MGASHVWYCVQDMNKCVLVCCGRCRLPEANHHLLPCVLFLPISLRLCGSCVGTLWIASPPKHAGPCYPAIHLCYWFFFLTSPPPLSLWSFIFPSLFRGAIERARMGPARGQSRDLRACRRGGGWWWWWWGGWKNRAAVGLVSEGVWEVGRGGGHPQPGLWMSRKRATLGSAAFLSRSLFVSVHSHGSILPSPTLLPPSYCSKAPLVHTLPHALSPPQPLLLTVLLSLALSACLPSLLPGGPGQRWRHSRDLQEICLSEKQLVSLSTTNVCMLRPPSPLLLYNPRPVPDTVHFPSWGCLVFLRSVV